MLKMKTQKNREHQHNFGICPKCRRTIKITKTGTLWRHGRQGQGNECAGSYKPPSDLQEQNPEQIITPLIDEDPGHVFDAPTELFASPVRSVRFLPRALVPITADRLSSALREIARDPDDCSKWWVLLLFPRRLVENPNMRKESRAKRNEQLRAQILGERESPTESGPTNPREFDGNALRRAVRSQVDAGQINRAIKLVIDDGKLMSPDARTLIALKEKHPKGQLVKTPKLLASTAPSLNLDKEAIVKAINGMSTVSAAGPDGLRPSHLRQLIGPVAGASREQLLEALCDFASLCTKGQVPPEAAPYFFGPAL